MHEKSVLRDAFFRKQKTEDRGQKRAKRGALRGTMPRERKRRSAAVPAARFPAAVSLSPDRGFSFFRAKEREKSAEKRKKAPGFGYGESGDGVRTCGAEKRHLISPTATISLNP
jgi:hypothetical protein